MNPDFRFRPLSFSWVALHPHPKGVVQFIGGAFFGTFPTLFYRYFLEQIFAAGYTVVALPFRFSFRHWPLALSLLKEQEKLQREMAIAAEHLGYDTEIYANKSQYSWVGHSLGCKYVALLEFLSDRRWPEILSTCASSQQVQQIQAAIDQQQPEEVSIKGQPSLLLAPDISDTESAIPVRSLAKLLDRWGLGVLPTRQQTQCLVESSQLFNLTGLISFDRDDIAGSVRVGRSLRENDVLWLINQLKQRAFPLLHQELPGKHLEPNGIRLGNWIVDFNPLDKFAEPVQQRHLEAVALQFLTQLRQREQAIATPTVLPDLETKLEGQPDPLPVG